MAASIHKHTQGSATRNPAWNQDFQILNPATGPKAGPDWPGQEKPGPLPSPEPTMRQEGLIKFYIKF